MYLKPKGTQDIYGDKKRIFEEIRNHFQLITKKHHFHLIDTPIFENAELFIRTSGELSDIVKKEMYVFEDKAHRKLALKPEGTAPVIRAIIENNLFEYQKFAYFSPFFRYERPQKGRQRQFHQIGVEYISTPNPFADIQIIQFANDFLSHFIPNQNWILKINCIGDDNARQKYVTVLKEYFSKYYEQLTPVSQQRLAQNPLRILDDKEEMQKEFVQNAPKIWDYLNEESKQMFEDLQKLFDLNNIQYQIDYNLVRGLDYYDEFVFEYIDNTNILGSKSTILGGGRYNKLIQELGGPNLSAIGFGAGVERLIEIYQNFYTVPNLTQNDFYIGSTTKEQLFQNITLAFKLRNNNFKVEFNNQMQNIKNIFKSAFAKNATYLIFYELNQPSNTITIKNLNNGKKTIINFDKLFSIKNISQLEGEQEWN